jgi:hypothetical protein
MSVGSRTWTRWQDYVAGIAGLYAALSPIWTNTDAAARSALIVLGVLLVLSALWSLAQPGVVASEYVHAVLGVLLFISPWVLGYSALGGASWASWVVGVIAVVAGLWAVPESNKAHHAALGH